MVHLFKKLYNYQEYWDKKNWSIYESNCKIRLEIFQLKTIGVFLAACVLNGLQINDN